MSAMECTWPAMPAGPPVGADSAANTGAAGAMHRAGPFAAKAAPTGTRANPTHCSPDCSKAFHHPGANLPGRGGNAVAQRLAEGVEADFEGVARARLDAVGERQRGGAEVMHVDIAGAQELGVL